jgi:uncharacterized protein YyaL (SSP411 family)
MERGSLAVFLSLWIAASMELAQPAGEVWDRAVFDRMDRQVAATDTPEMRTGDHLAWGEAYLQQGYVEMYQATGDRYYLRRLCGSADAVLANRDDRRGLRDYSGQVHAAWSVDAQYTTAELVLKDTTGRDALRLRSIRALRKVFEEQRLYQGASGHLMLCYALLFKWWRRLGGS